MIGDPEGVGLGGDQQEHTYTHKTETDSQALDRYTDRTTLSLVSLNETAPKTDDYPTAQLCY